MKEEEKNNKKNKKTETKKAFLLNNLCIYKKGDDGDLAANRVGIGHQVARLDILLADLRGEEDELVYLGRSIGTEDLDRSEAAGLDDAVDGAHTVD